MVTVPGFYLGKVMPWHGVYNTQYWLATAVLGIGSLLALVKLSPWYLIFPRASESRGFRPWARSFLSFLFFLAAGYVLTGYFWWYTGKIALASAKRDVAAAGYQLVIPGKAPGLPDEKNAVYLFNQAWNAPSMRTYGPVKPIFDTPHKGRFEENTRMFGNLTDQTDLSRKLFLGNKTEYAFLVAFNSDAMADNLTGIEITYAYKLLRDHEDAFRFMDRAFEQKSFDWGIDYNFDPSWESSFPNLGNPMTLARLLQCRAFMQARNGDIGRAVKSLQTGLFLGDVMGQSHFLVGEMVHAAIVRMLTPMVRVLLPKLEAKGRAGAEFLSFLQPKMLEQGFFISMESSLFWYHRSFETMGWLSFAIYFNDENTYFYFGKNKILSFLLGFIYRPFSLFDLASSYEYKIKFMKEMVSNSGHWNQEYINYQLNGWLLGLRSVPRISQFGEKVRESMTYCGKAQLSIESRMFHQKHKHWPATAEELEKWCRDIGYPMAGGNGPIPEVAVTGSFVIRSQSPAGNMITLGRKGEAPTTSGSGWLYDSNLGAIYVNSTVQDSRQIAYSFYGFE